MTTPDRMPMAKKPSHLDKTEHGTVGRENRPQIVENKLGPSCHLDAPNKSLRTNAEPGLGAGGGRLGDAVASLKSAGGKASKGHTVTAA